MRRGSTPTLTYQLPFSIDEIGDTIGVFWLTFSQKGVEVFTKTLNDVTIDKDIITCELSQEDTLSLQSDEYVDMQIRMKLADSQMVYTSEIMHARVERVLKGGLI